jgi:cytoskeletal protein RodZ
MSSRIQKIIFLVVGLVLVLIFLYYLLNFVVLPLWVNKAVPEDQKENSPILRVEDRDLKDYQEKTKLANDSQSSQTTSDLTSPEPNTNSVVEPKPKADQIEEEKEETSQFLVFSRGTPDEQINAYKI